MVDGVHFGQHAYVVALGIGIDGVKHPLAVEEDSTENATLVTDLITGLRERGLDVTRPILAVLDGARALPRAVKDVFGQPLIQRCQQYKIRNVTGKLPDWLKQVTARWMRQMRMLSMPSFTLTDVRHALGLFAFPAECPAGWVNAGAWRWGRQV